MPRLRMPDQVTDLGDFLREQREQARLSVRQLAQVAGVSNPYLSQIERGLRRPSAEVLQQIAKGLRISAEALYVRAGILEESAGLDVEVAIRTDPALTERQRRVLLEIYASFQAENGRTRSQSATKPTASRPEPVTVPTVPTPATPRAGRKRSAPRRRPADSGPADGTTTSPTSPTKRASKKTTTKRAAAPKASATERTTS